MTPGREREHQRWCAQPESVPAAAGETFNTRQLAQVAAGKPVETKQSRQRKRAAERKRERELEIAEQKKKDEARRAAFLAVSTKRKCELLPNDLPRTARMIVNRTEHTATSAARELERVKSSDPTFGAALEKTMLGVASTTRTRLRPFDALKSRRARRVVACGSAMLFLSQATDSPGRAFLVEGTLRGTLCSLFKNADTKESVHHNTLFSTQTDSTRKGRWDCGAVVALERGGCIEKIQPPAHSQRARFVGRDRKGNPRAINQYFIRRDVIPGGDAESVEARAFAEWERWLAGRPARAARRAETRGPPRAAPVQ